MTDPNNPNYHQYNSAANGGTVYSSQGGRQIINNNLAARRARTFAGWALLASVGIDLAYCFYGMTAYTGRPNDSGDLWRAVIFLVLLAVTGSLLRRWLRRRL